MAVIATFGKGFHGLKKGFSIRRVAPLSGLQLEAWSGDVDLATAQPFRYLGRGRQCFAFESLDGKYVLKLPRTDSYRVPFWMRALPFLEHKREVVRSMRAQREHFVFNSMRIAYEELREETGVFAIHFGKSERDVGKKISLFDPLGIRHNLPMSGTSFVLQTKQPLLMTAFLGALKIGNRAKARQILDAFIELVMRRGKKGIWNKDESFLRNYGFDGVRGYQIDTGSFYHRADAATSIQDAMYPVSKWLAKTDADMFQYFNHELRQKG